MKPTTTIIRIDNSFSQLVAPTVQMRYIKKQLRYKVIEKGNEYIPDEVKYVNLLEDTFFPTGLYKLVNALLNQKFGIIPTIIFHEETSRSQFFGNIDKDILAYTLRTYQAQIVKKALRTGRGIITVPTGGGKTIIQAAIAFYMAKLYPDKRTMTVMASNAAMQQTKQRFEEYGLADVGFYPSSAQHQISTMASISAKTSRMQLSCPLLESLGAFLVDECHRVRTARTWQEVLLGVDTFHKFGFSGTPFEKRETWAKNLGDARMVGFLGEEFCFLTRKYLVDRGFIQDTKVRIVSAPKIKHSLSFSNNYTKLYRDLILKNKERHEKTVGIIEAEIENGHKPLIIVRLIEHGNILLKMLAERDINVEFACGGGKAKTVNCHGHIVHGSSDGFSERLAGDLQCGIGSVIFGESFDCPEVTLLFNAAGGKSFIGIKQRIGRVMRVGGAMPAEFYDMDDSPNHGIFGNHLQKRLKFYEEEELSVIYE